jgi:hypothetical protein
MAAVNWLEANWIFVQEIFELVSHVLTWIFIGLWPKQRAKMPDNDLKKLAKAFDTPDDSILLMKGRSMKRGAEGAIALTYAHGEEVNWEQGRAGKIWGPVRISKIGPIVIKKMN